MSYLTVDMIKGLKNIPQTGKCTPNFIAFSCAIYIIITHIVHIRTYVCPCTCLLIKATFAIGIHHEYS